MIVSLVFIFFPFSGFKGIPYARTPAYSSSVVLKEMKITVKVQQIRLLFVQLKNVHPLLNI